MEEQFAKWYIDQLKDNKNTYCFDIKTYSHLLLYLAHIDTNVPIKDIQTIKCTIHKMPERTDYFIVRYDDDIRVNNLWSTTIEGFYNHMVNLGYKPSKYNEYIDNTRQYCCWNIVNVANSSIDLNINCDKKLLHLIAKKVINSITDSKNKLKMLIDQYNSLTQKITNYETNSQNLKTSITNLETHLNGFTLTIEDRMQINEQLIIIRKEHALLIYSFDIFNEVKKNINNINRQIINYMQFCASIQCEQFIQLETLRNKLEQQNKLINDEHNENLEKLFNEVTHLSSKTSDFTINFINDETNIAIQYQCHSFLIRASFFDKIANGNYKESTDNLINLHILHANTPIDFLKYVYLRKIEINENKLERLKSLSQLADFLQMENLYNICTNLIEIDNFENLCI